MIAHRPAILACLALPGLLLVAGCRPAVKAPKPKVAAEPNKPLGAEPRLLAARRQILAGQYAEAAEALAALDAEAGIAQPLHNWITVHHALALLFLGKNEEAQTAFAKLEERGVDASFEQEVKLGSFFTRTAKLLRAEDAVAPAVAKDFDKWTHEAVALLLFGLKNWNLERYAEALALLRQFHSSRPVAPGLWLGEEKELTRLRETAFAYIEDFNEHRTALAALEAARSPEQQKDAVEAAQAARARMTRQTKQAQELDARIAELAPKAAALMAEKERASSEDLAFDAKALPEAKQKRLALMAQMRFTEARAAILAPSLRTAAPKAEQELLAKKTQWLASFKTRLIEDLNTVGYRQPVPRKDGTPLGEAIIQADEQHLHLGSKRKPTLVPWSELAPQSLFAMAQSFIAPDLPPELAAYRKWNLGVFAAFIGKTAESRELLAAAAEAVPVFAEELPLFADPKAVL